ncbi:hypothetical protein F5B20DRAFT_550003, partial [Whalleya microplaca]
MDDSIVKSAGFKLPRIFSTRERMNDLFVSRPETTVVSTTRLSTLKGQNERLGRIFESAVNAWHKREEIMTLARPWYLMEHRAWQASPWSFNRYRLYIAAFALGFKRRDEYECRSVADSLLDALPLDIPEQYLDTDVSFRWLFHSIGLLMLAAVPIRKGSKTVPPEEKSVTFLP